MALIPRNIVAGQDDPGAARLGLTSYQQLALGSIPSRSTCDSTKLKSQGEALYFNRRLAAFKSTSRAHVTGFASSCSAAAWIAAFSSAVSGSFMLDVRRSSGFLGGLLMTVIIPIKTTPSTLVRRHNYGYNNSVD